MSKIDVLFVQPNGSHNVYQNLSKDLSAREPNVWALLLAQRLQVEGYGVGYLDCEVLHLELNEEVNSVRSCDPKLIVMYVSGQQPSASTQNFPAVVDLCKELKNIYPEYNILLLGNHISALPERSLKESAADFVGEGEGLYTILDLLQTDLVDSSQLKKVSGLWFWEYGLPVNYVSPKQIVDLDNELPGIAWNLLPDVNLYRTSNWHVEFDRSRMSPFISILTSLNCPYHCSYCMIKTIFGGSGFKFWSPEFTLSQFDRIVQLGIKNVKIVDEMHALNPNHFIRLHKLIYEKYGSDVFNMWAYARVDTTKEKHLDTLKKSGVNWLAIGYEAKNKKVRLDVDKGKFEDIDMYDITRKIHNYGINIIGNFIMGLPLDTHETMQETLDFAMEIMPEMFNVYSTMPYPGSELYNIAIKEGRRLPKNWIDYSQHSYTTTPLDTKYLSAEEVLRFRDNSFYTYFTNPSYLSYINSRFGLQAVEEIKKMTSIRLKRKLLGD